MKKFALLLLALLAIAPATRAAKDQGPHLGQSSMETWHYLLALNPAPGGGAQPLYVTVTFNQSGAIMLPAHYASVQWLNPGAGKTGQHTHGNPLMQEAARLALEKLAQQQPPNHRAMKLHKGFKAGKRYNFTVFQGKKGLADISGRPFFLKFGQLTLVARSGGYDLNAPLPGLGPLKARLSPDTLHDPVFDAKTFDWQGLPTLATLSRAMTVKATLAGKPLRGLAWALHTWGLPPRRGQYTPLPTAQALLLGARPTLWQWRLTTDPAVVLGPGLRALDSPTPQSGPLRPGQMIPSADHRQRYPLTFSAPAPKPVKGCARWRFAAIHPAQEDSLFAGLSGRFQGYFSVACDGGKPLGAAWVRLMGFGVGEK